MITMQTAELKIHLRRMIRQWERSQYGNESKNHTRYINDWADIYFEQNIKQQQQNDSKVRQ
jgi:hypothetical protein